MKTSILKDKIIPVLVIIIIWQIASMVIKQEILLVSPVSVIKTLGELIPTIDFWKTIMFSFSRIMLGFFIALVMGMLLSYISYKSKIIRNLIQPIMVVIKATPVVSFIILALVWMNSKNLSVLISFLMVVPIIYTSILEGALNVDKKMLEMSKLFKVKWFKKFTYIYIPTILPFFISACTVSLGFCWKSGIAAEVIGIPGNSIGEKLYMAKIYLNTSELFAWTVVIIVISVVFEKIFMKMVKRLVE